MRQAAVMVFGLFAIVMFAVPPASAQTPELHVANVVIGPQHLETRYVLTWGKWSDAEKTVGTNSTYIHCYEKPGIGEDADAYTLGGQAFANLTT